ncbi:MAG TPA: glycosyltransferase family 39 protein [Anaerolinea sp.]|nr:glycosyltransferase family 39 protein [Anaerolinea sp.]
MNTLPSKSIFKRESILLTILIPVLFFLTCWNLVRYPILSGWDEGIYLQFSENLSRYGIYGSIDGDHFHPLLPVGGTGPTLIGTLALAYQIFGESLLVARVVMAAFLLASVVGFYLLVKEISRWEIAVAGVFFYLFAGYGSFDTLWIGRQVLAEIPSYAFLFFGLWLFIQSLRKTGTSRLIASLVLLGLSVVTKNQFIWVLTPAFGAMMLIDLVILKQKRWLHFAAATLTLIASYAVWHFGTIFLVKDNYQDYQQAQFALLSATFLRWNVFRWVETIKLFIKSGYGLPILLSIAYTLFSIRKHPEDRLTRGLLLCLDCFGLFSALVLSLPWARYIYTGIVFALPLFVLMVHDHILLVRKTRWLFARYAAFSAVFVMVGFIGVKFIIDTGLILRSGDQHAITFGQQVDQKVPAGELVMNWEWEIEFFSQSTYVHPDYQLFPAMIDQTYNQVDAPILDEPRIPAGVHYVVTGPFAIQTRVFEAELAARGAECILQMDAYRLYFLHSNPSLSGQPGQTTSP